MKNKDLQTLDMLRGEFEKSVDSAKVPLKLQKQSVVHMLEKDAETQKAQAQEAENKKYQVVTIRKLMAIAAMLAVVVSGALVMRTGGTSVALNIVSHESGNVLNSGESYNKIFEDIILNTQSAPTNPDISATQPSVKPEITQQTPVTSAPTSVQHTVSDKEDVLAGYIYKEAETEQETLSELQTGNSVSVSKFDDFEADIVKADGDYLYVLTSGINEETKEISEVILVVKIIPDDQMQVISEIPVSLGDNNGKIDECVEIYLQKNCLVTVCNSRSFSTDEEVYSDGVVTAAYYYDITDPAAPVKIHEHIQDGEYVSSRLCDKKLYLVTSTTFSEITEETAAESIIPGTQVNGEYVKVTAENIFYDNIITSAKSFTYVTVTDISKLSQPVQFAFTDGGKDVSCHADTIIISRNFIRTNEVTGAAEDCTFVYRFNVKGDEISYANQVSEMNGKIIGGISVDERSGHLKTVTLSSGGYNVYVHNKEMKCIDTVEDVLLGEEVKTVKYIGNRVYLVYGEKTSIIDFSKKLKAENIVTVSTASLSNSLYEVADSVLLGVGVNRETAKTVLTLFDFSNPESFKSTDTYELPEGYSLAAGNDGRCIMIDSEKMIFGIPVIRANAETKTDVSSYLVFSVDGGEITQIGECIHDDAVVGDAAVRSVCAGNAVYTVSGGKIVSHSTEDYKEISRVEF